MAAQFQFVMRSGPTPGSVYSLEGDQLVIGRDASSGVAINDAEVSRKHARLTFQGGKYVIEDLGSTNGTFVNGQRVTSSVVLKSGDVVGLGEQIVLLYEALSADAGATMIGRKAPARPAPVPAAAAPQPSPQYASAPAPSAAGRRNLPLLIGLVVLGVICLCAVVFVAVDQLNLWCQFPFSLITPILGGSC
jgi:pSer/pThr/pTyr-binding forkhead associated (FHA) protein